MQDPPLPQRIRPDAVAPPGPPAPGQVSPELGISTLASAVSHARNRLEEDLRWFTVFDVVSGEEVFGQDRFSAQTGALFGVAQRLEARLPADGLGVIRDWWMLNLPGDDLSIVFLRMGGRHRGILAVDNRFGGPTKLFGNVIPGLLLQCSDSSGTPPAPGAVTDSGSASTHPRFVTELAEDLAALLPTLGLSPHGVVLTQHQSSVPGLEPVVLAEFDADSSQAQVLDAGRVSMAQILNQVVARPSAQTTPGAPVPLPPAPVPEAPVAAATPSASGVTEPEIWTAFEEAIRPQLGRGAAKAVKASRKAAAQMGEAELVAFLSDRLEAFGAQAISTFRTALHL